MTLFVEIAKELPNNVTQPIFVLIGIFASGMVVIKSPQLLSSVLGGEVAITDSLGYLIGLSTASKGLAFGATAMLAGKKRNPPTQPWKLYSTKWWGSWFNPLGCSKVGSSYECGCVGANDSKRCRSRF